MQKILLLFALLAFYLGWDLYREYRFENLHFELGEHGEIVLLTTSWCGYCRDAKMFLDDKKIPYTEHDVEKSQQGQELYRQHGGGGVPLIVIGDQVIRGFDRRALRRALESATSIRQ